jgi:hypothetical protein
MKISKISTFKVEMNHEEATRVQQQAKARNLTEEEFLHNLFFQIGVNAPEVKKTA